MDDNSREIRQQELARLLLQKARQDLDLVVNVAGTETVADVHVQQAVEKSLKSALTRFGVQYEYTHDLSRLYWQAEDYGLKLPTAVDAVEELTVFAVQFRYLLFQDEQGFDRNAGLILAEKFIEWANEIIESSSSMNDTTDDNFAD